MACHSCHSTQDAVFLQWRRWRHVGKVFCTIVSYALSSMWLYPSFRKIIAVIKKHHRSKVENLFSEGKKVFKTLATSATFLRYPIWKGWEPVFSGKKSFINACHSCHFVFCHILIRKKKTLHNEKSFKMTCHPRHSTRDDVVVYRSGIDGII